MSRNHASNALIIRHFDVDATLVPFLFVLIVAISIVSTSLGIFNGSLFSTMYKVTMILAVIAVFMAIIGAFVFGMGKDN